MYANVTTSTIGAAAARRALFVLLTTTALQIAGTGSSQAAPTTPLPGHFSGGAHGVAVGVALNTSTLLILNSASENCPCHGTNGITRTTTMPTLSVSSILTASTNTASAVADKADGKATSADSATVTAASLFDGAITADAVTAEAGVVATPTTLTTSSAGTKLVNLVIAGQAIAPDVPENTTVTLPGLGSVIVKAVTPTSSSQDASIVVHGLEITIAEENKYGLSIGTKITVGDASAGYSRIQPAAVLAGFALTGIVSGDASAAVAGSGKFGAAVGIPGCAGTGGATNTRVTENLDIPGLAQATVGKVTAFAGPVGAANVTKTTSTVTDVSLLNGLITAGTLTAVAQETRSGMVSTASTIGSGFTDLKIAGLTIPLTAKPNLTVSVPGFGSVTVNEQIAKPALGSVHVTELDVRIDKTNILGIPVGTHLALGTAEAVAKKF